MFDNIMKFFKKFNKKEESAINSKDAAKERLHLVLMQDRANVSADFLELMKQEIIDVIKKYIDVDENAIDVRLTNKENSDGTNGAPALYANIPILNIKNDSRKVDVKDDKNINEEKKNDKLETEKEEKAEKSDTKKDKKDNKEENVEIVIDDSSMKDEEKVDKEDITTEEEQNSKDKVEESKEEVKSEKK